MRKYSKILAFVGITSALAYVAFRVTNRFLSRSDKSPMPFHKNDSHRNISEMNHRIIDTDQISTEGSDEEGYDNYERPTGGYSNVRTQKMYKDLGMTDDQKRRYEKDYRTVMDDWERNNPNQEMDEQQKVDEHNAALNAVLNEAQYSIYRDWSKKHAF